MPGRPTGERYPPQGIMAYVDKMPGKLLTVSASTPNPQSIPESKTIPDISGKLLQTLVINGTQYTIPLFKLIPQSIMPVALAVTETLAQAQSISTNKSVPDIPSKSVQLTV